LLLHDRDTIAKFLSNVAERDPALKLSSFVVAACREFGSLAFAQELKQLLASQHNRRGRWEDSIPLRDIKWLCEFCCDRNADEDRLPLAKELCAMAVEQFCVRPAPKNASYRPRYWRRETSAAEKALPRLLQALLAADCEAELSRAIRFVQETPDEFSMDDCLAPCLKSLIPWSRKRFGSVPPQLQAWLDTVRQQLESATAEEPQAPTDWTRPAEVACTCQYCAQLNAFLADPVQEQSRIAAREDMRRHVIGKINEHLCDVKHSLERKGSPHRLLLTKTTGSYDRAVKRFAADRKLLSVLLSVS
jgi:hypothetical protein